MAGHIDHIVAAVLRQIQCALIAARIIRTASLILDVVAIARTVIVLATGQSVLLRLLQLRRCADRAVFFPDLL